MIDRVDADRLRDLTLELVEIESPTGDTAAVARRYADVLREIGLEVEVLDEPFPATPVVIGRLRGASPGRRSSSTGTSTPSRSRTIRRASRTAASGGAEAPT